MPSTAPPAAGPPRLEFLESHRPALPSGVYEVSVVQTLAGQGVPVEGATFRAAERFGVFGERFSLPEAGVVAVFPPAGALGDYADVLPHVALRRSTLPWERMAVATGGGEPTPEERAIPWLALLVFAEDEVAAPPNVALSTLAAAAPGWPGVAPEPAQHGEDLVATIEVPRALLTSVLPTAAELRLLAHARRGMDDAGLPVGEEWSVVVANRLPAPGVSSVAHLVSLEHRFRRAAAGEPPVFDLAGAPEGGRVRLVSLRSWRFGALPGAGRLSELLRGLDRAPVALRLPPGALAAEPYLERGYVPVPHVLRGGASTVSWYHGPLVPPGTGEPPPDDLLPARGADSLVRFHEDTGLFDVSYAAAWELGRLLALNADRFSRALFAWRHAWTHYAAADVHFAAPFLGAPPLSSDPPPLPEVVLAWLGQAAQLRGVPFNYLVSDARLLPPESLRYFHVDAAWIAALLDGALGVGRTSAAHDEAHALHQPLVEERVRVPVSGVLIRSAAISGWPTLMVEGYDRSLAPGVGDDDPLPAAALRGMLRSERLSPSVLLCLWDGEVDTVDLHQPPEALHFGIRPGPPGDPPRERWSKALRDADAKETELVVDPVPVRPGERRVVDVAALSSAMAAHGEALGFPGVTPATGLNSAQFALEMVEGVPRMRFRI